ncbi:MAG: hypothetical protein RSB90_11175 [Eubacterium sp.]
MLRKITLITVMTAIIITSAITITIDNINNDVPKAPIYVLKEFNNKIGVYRYGKTSPERSIDVFTDSLPQKDRDELKDGVLIYSDTELQRLIEDFDG